MDWVWALVGAIGGALVAAATAFGYLIKARADWKQGSATDRESERKDVEELLRIKDEIIAELRAEAKRAEIRELGWVEERFELKDRLSKVEGDYRHLVEAVTKSGICAIAPNCVNYVAPGKAE